jgi:hypothetical protein
MSTIINRFKRTEIYKRCTKCHHDWEASIITGLVEDLEEALLHPDERQQVGTYYSLIFQVYEILNWNGAKPNYMTIIRRLNQLTRHNYDLQFLYFYKYSISATSNSNFISPIW